MRKMYAFMIAGTAALASSGAAMAGGKSHEYQNHIRNLAQITTAPIYANLHLYAGWVGGDLRGTAAAIGNNASIATEGSTVFENNQRQLGDVGAMLSAHAYGVGGDVELTAIAICNNARVVNTKSGGTAVGSLQACNTLDPWAYADVSLDGVGGDATVTAAAIANNLAIEGETAGVSLYNWQFNPATVYAETNVNFHDVAGDATASAVAIGNNLSVDTGF